MARLLLDTHTLVWLPTGDPRLSRRAAAAIADTGAELFVSAVTAFELAELQARGRIAMTEPLGAIVQAVGAAVIELPPEVWSIVSALPDIHRDPVDRMLVAHAMIGDFDLVTADRAIRRYPIRTIW